MKKTAPPSNAKKNNSTKYDRFNPTQRDILTKKERHSLLLATKKYDEVMFIRIGLNSGLRLQEIVDLTPLDLIYEDNVIRVRSGKGNKGRWACCDNATLQIVHAYITENKIGDNDKIFSKSNRAYQYMVDRVAERANIKRIHVTPHILRHTNITMLLEKGMPIEQVREHAGHEDIGTTMIYTHLSYAQRKEKYMEIMGE